MNFWTLSSLDFSEWLSQALTETIYSGNSSDSCTEGLTIEDQEMVNSVKERVSRAGIVSLMSDEQPHVDPSRDRARCQGTKQDWGAPYLVAKAIKGLKDDLGGRKIHEEWYWLFESILSRTRPMSRSIEDSVRWATPTNPRSKLSLENFQRLKDTLNGFTLEQLTKIYWFHDYETRYSEAFRWTERTREILRIYCENRTDAFMLARPPAEFWEDQFLYQK